MKLFLLYQEGVSFNSTTVRLKGKSVCHTRYYSVFQFYDSTIKRLAGKSRVDYHTDGFNSTTVRLKDQHEKAQRRATEGFNSTTVRLKGK